MDKLTPVECRVLGVLVEKAQTTPAQYPLTLNGLVTGCNQKSNRDPVTSFDEDDVLEALDSLRTKHLVREVLLSGSRVGKFRHNAREALEIDTSTLVVLAELLLRGPQTVGELRGRASRMHQLESIEVVENVLQNMMERQPPQPPMVRRLSPAPGSRAARYAQLLCPDLHPLDAPAATAATPAAGAAPGTSRELEQRVAALEAQVAELKQVIERLATTATA